MVSGGGRNLDEVDAFIVGVPKAGTTWLANILSQHNDITLSSPKEPNITSSHRGTFDRITDEPNWEKYSECFLREGLRIDASVHTFACPLAPERLANRMPNIRLVLCLREPVERAVSHWKMIRDFEGDTRFGADWSDFNVAWGDDRLRCDSLYGEAISRWLEHFGLDNFLIIDSQSMRGDPEKTIATIERFLGVNHFEYNFEQLETSNLATDRIVVSRIGRILRTLFSLIPTTVKAPIVRFLQARDIDIYRTRLLSKRSDGYTVSVEHYATCSPILCEDLRLFENLTGFGTSHWVEKIESMSSGSNTGSI